MIIHTVIQILYMYMLRVSAWGYHTSNPFISGPIFGTAQISINHLEIVSEILEKVSKQSKL